MLKVSFSRKRQRDTDDDVKEAGSGGRDVKRHEHSSYDLDSPDHEDDHEWITKGNSLPSEDDTVLDFINEQNHMPGEVSLSSSISRERSLISICSCCRMLLPARTRITMIYTINQTPQYEEFIS